MKKKLLFLIVFLCIITKAQIYDNVLSFHNIAYTPISNGIKIKTNIPFVQSSDMLTINIEGFAYGAYKNIGIVINWYVWNNEFYVTSNTSS